MKKQKVKHKKSRKLLWILLGIAGFVFFFFVVGVVYGGLQHDKQCGIPHPASSMLPTKLETASDYFQQANYDYDIGNCQNAIEDYTKSLEKNPDSAEAYNNRAYTYMRMQNYKDALADLDRAIALRPNYIHALMNRGDIYNYYYRRDPKKALEDYNLVLKLDPQQAKATSLCGHRLLAENNGWSLNVFVSLLQDGMKAGCTP